MNDIDTKILNEITTYCSEECSSVNECAEDNCVLGRIENLIIERIQK